MEPGDGWHAGGAAEGGGLRGAEWRRGADSAEAEDGVGKSDVFGEVIEPCVAVAGRVQQAGASTCRAAQLGGVAPDAGFDSEGDNDDGLTVALCVDCLVQCASPVVVGVGGGNSVALPLLA